MNVLVIGGTRFIGLHLVQELVRQGNRVTTFNRGRTPTPLPPGVERLYGDRRQPDQVHQALAGKEYEAVFDVIGYSGPDVEVMAALFAGRIRHFVFISTTAVYAPSEYAPIDEDFPLNRAPNAGAYAAGKIECEDLLLEAHRRHGFPVTIIRPAFVYGPDDHLYDREAGFFYRIEKGRQVLVPLEGNFLFQHGHVDDLAAACLAAVGNPKALGQAYTVTGPHAVTANGYVSALAQAVGRPADVVHVPLAVMNTLAKPIWPYGWQRSAVYSIEKAKRDLNWQPQYSLEAGHQQTYRWFSREKMADKLTYDFAHEDEVLARLDG